MTTGGGQFALYRACKKFINDLPDIFDIACDGIDIGMLDDVILLSTTEAGLQNCISKLEKYCDDWCIEVNLVKSKDMIFNKAGKFLIYINDIAESFSGRNNS